MGLVAALSIPLMVLNILGGIVSGIWLAVLRDWGTIGLGIGLFLVSTLLLGLALMPSLLLAAPAALFAERGKMIGLVFFSTLSSLYILALITVWCCGILFLFLKDATAANLIPRLIWSYGAATGPWAYMASKGPDPDAQGFGPMFATFLAELAYLILMLIVIFSGITLLGAIRVFGCFMLVGLVVQITFLAYLQREQQKLERGAL